MSLILAVDTSAKPVSCALVQNQKVLASFYANTGLTHSQTLMPMIEQLLRVANVSMDQVDALAVNAGPGSFTGVRIGVSTVKGLVFTGDKPCISVSTLEAMAENLTLNEGDVICGVMDARCQQVYTALFTRDSEGRLVRLTSDEAIAISDLGTRLASIERPIVLVGDGSELCYRALKDTLPQLILSVPSARYQTAASVAVVAERLYEAGETVSGKELLPIYLRLPQAERELMNKSKAGQP